MSDAEQWAGVAEEYFQERLGLAHTYADLLVHEGIEWGLIGPREADRLWERHIMNSLAIADAVPGGALVADIGSGAGLPGIPLALARPDVRVDLVEPMERRCAFLQLCVERLSLSDRVSVYSQRVENYTKRHSKNTVTKSTGTSGSVAKGPGEGVLQAGDEVAGPGHKGPGLAARPEVRPTARPEVVTCRALSRLKNLISMVSGLVPPATLVALKGAQADNEIAEAGPLLRTRHLAASAQTVTRGDLTLGTVVTVSPR